MRLMAVMMAALIAASAFSQEAASEFAGVWLTKDRQCRVEISKTDDGTYQGCIVWLKEPNYPKDDQEAGKPCRDRNNPDPTKRNQTILGLRILSGFKHESGNVLKEGTIYNPDNGKNYSGKLTLKSADRLNVRGFIGFSFIGGSEEWTRWIGEGKKK